MSQRIQEILRDALKDVKWLERNAAGRRTKDDEQVWDKLGGMRARLISAISEFESAPQADS